MPTMSRAARNRLARDNRETRPVSSRPVVELVRPPVPVLDPAGIRTIGYTGYSRRNSVSYAGSESGGYRSLWAASPQYVTAVTIDKRWSQTITDYSTVDR